MSDWETEAAARNVEIDATIARLGLTVESVFVPFSASRNKAEKHKSLNWRVTLKRNGRDVLTCDYSAGIAHCPGYKATKAPATFRPAHYRNREGGLRFASAAETLAQYRDAVCAAECESGVAMESDGFAGGTYENTFKPRRVRDSVTHTSRPVPILPEPRDVIYSLAMDSSVLDSGGFENWAAEYGYDTDSRKAESIYRLCLEYALAMRAALGDSGMAELHNAFQDY